ncbi:PD-(D/E)XK nuclease [Halorubrum sodomense tailed virus 4]|uniref:PD-(D/E)XK nuclease n=1 Tax=Halorubrum sodomense tailed virus 4 TaxID=2878013 RepID=A0AAE8XXM7_9CAUD|nr:PD-(D/E)XK nuclease [Halorubrum sodomense tailed virus 4]UBF20278.1 PD-(D/E)XK nuclease [Halorubrum sodomense tailed virus 4]UBF21567.1 PD-(D/E)XK endonuclease [Halorubrum virus HRTV-24]UBF21966.1 PD-(D/E)XK endonuclease [Haloarcula virus HJTV-3]UBF22095.1 PD-(D/E)XK endonuclease [Halorubrum virus HRTV-15]
MASKTDGIDRLRRGDISELKVTTALIELGHGVSNTVGDNQRYDLIADINGELHRVQCKTASNPPSQSSYQIELRNRSYRTGGKIRKQTYTGDEIDVYAVYNPHSDEIYWIPFDEAPDEQMRITPKSRSEIVPANRAKANCADELLISERLPSQ